MGTSITNRYLLTLMYYFHALPTNYLCLLYYCKTNCIFILSVHCSFLTCFCCLNVELTFCIQYSFTFTICFSVILLSCIADPLEKLICAVYFHKDDLSKYIFCSQTKLYYILSSTYLQCNYISVASDVDCHSCI